MRNSSQHSAATPPLIADCKDFVQNLSAITGCRRLLANYTSPSRINVHPVYDYVRKIRASYRISGGTDLPEMRQLPEKTLSLNFKQTYSAYNSLNCTSFFDLAHLRGRSHSALERTGNPRTGTYIFAGAAHVLLSKCASAAVPTCGLIDMCCVSNVRIILLSNSGPSRQQAVQGP